jgi:hypothetical protein
MKKPSYKKASFLQPQINLGTVTAEFGIIHPFGDGGAADA